MSYVLCADIHAHAWSAFSGTDAHGVNTRLQLILDELRRAGETALRTTTKVMIIAGDLFHTRGNIAPSVLNPVFDVLRDLVDRGVNLKIMSGNHDLEGKDATRISSAVTSLEGTGAFVAQEVSEVETAKVVMVPWVESIAALKELLEGLYPPAPGRRGDYDLILHAPINGVILGIPDHGLEPAWLAALGWKRVFSGHYHDHKVFGAGKVVSIGAIGHHNWNDVGTDAGFIWVEDHGFAHTKSSMPKFVDLVAGMNLNEAVPGNYIRAKITSSKMDDVNQMREGLEKLGAKGVMIVTVKQPAEQREGAPAVAGSSKTLQQSVTEFATAAGRFAHAAEVATEALKCFAEANAE